MSHADEGTLHAYLDGELAAAERTRLEAHLAECATCRERLAEERGLIERADRLLTLAALPAGHTHRPAPVQPRRSRPRFVVPGVWAASIAAAFLAGWLLRPTPQFRAEFQLPNDNQVAAAPAPKTVRMLARNESADHLQKSRAAVRDSGVAMAYSSADTRVDSTAALAPAPTPARQSVTPEVAGKVAGPTLRGAPPTPVPPTSVAVTPASPLDAAPRAEAAMSTSRARPIGTTWTVIGPEPARKALGMDMAQIPGLPVRDILQNPLAPGQVVVEQELAQGTVIQLLQSVQQDTVMLPFSNEGSRLQRTVGRLQVRISGPLPRDSLLKLLELVR